MYEIGVIDEFEAAHALTGDFGPAARLHGHTYRVEVRVAARAADATGAIYDIGKLRAGLRAVLEELHYRNLNDVAELAGVNTTAEMVARHIFERIEPPLRSASLAGLKVTVWESPSVFASYREEFEP
ncbi:MAG TPA: 6-carboxytetrahydropterin synthase [Blastocatellia bacterium]|nr:6-carboxytetrahydropterin synthase [Blastocatellia bacterium]